MGPNSTLVMSSKGDNDVVMVTLSSFDQGQPPALTSAHSFLATGQIPATG